MSKRTRTRRFHTNPTTERRRRQKRHRNSLFDDCNDPNCYSIKKNLDKNLKLFNAQEELEKNYSFKNIERVATLSGNISYAKAYYTTDYNGILLVVKGREGVHPGPETINWVGTCISSYLPPGVGVRVVGDINSKSLKMFCRTQEVSAPSTSQ